MSIPPLSMNRPGAGASPRTFRARWVVPVVGEPLAGGMVSVHDGRIVGVGRHLDGPVEDLGDVILLPGLVNAHTHLEFSDLSEPLGQPAQVFPDWIGDVVAWKRGRKGDSRAAIERGLDESRALGVVALGEIATGAEWGGELSPSADVTVFHEIICPTSNGIPQALAAAADFLQRRARDSAWKPGLSPHAPYTVHPRAIAELVARAIRHRVPISMHLAESREELELLEHGTGKFRQRLDAFGIDWPYADLAECRRPLGYLRILSDAPRVLVIHGNYLDAAEIEFVAAHRKSISVVYCPRTHAYFGHERHPLVQLLAAGASVALGTDGRGSNPDLSVLAEMRFVACKFPALSPRTILELGTIRGARALGIEPVVGSIEPGKRGALISLPVDSPTQGDPYEAIVHGSANVSLVVE